MRDGLAKTMACLATLSLSIEDAGTVELVLAEALNNVIEHALTSTGSDTVIEIRGHYGAEGLQLSIIDRGLPMPHGRTPHALAPNVDVSVEEMPEGGFGWYMIHSLAKDVRYARVGGRNHLTVLIEIGS